MNLEQKLTELKRRDSLAEADWRVAVTRIGEMVRGKQMTLTTADGKTQPLKAAGWERFGG